MNRQDLANILATQLITCMGDRNYGYSSSSNHKYSHLTESGEKLMADLINAMAPVADKIRQEEIKIQARDAMLASIKD